MTTSRTLVVVGASLAGAKAAAAARGAGFGGRIVLVGDETHLPYERPPLSKGVLRGEAEPSSAAVDPEGFYRDNGIELLLGRSVSSLDIRGRDVTFADGERIAFDGLVLATGATARRLPLPGADLPGVHYLRTLDDSLALGAAIRDAERVAVIGAGWIGTEVAASARTLGADVVLIDLAPLPLQRVLGDEMGEVFRRLHADHGVRLRLGTGISQLCGTDRVEGVALADGTVEPADVVVIGVGVAPRVELATAAGLAVDNGVVVDEHLQTAVAGVYAAGDVASAWHPAYGQHVRVEHWANALNQGPVAGRNAVGGREIYDRLPYFYSDQYDLGMEYVGLGDPTDAVTVRGDVDDRKFIAFWQRAGRVTAAMNVNVWDVVDDLKAVIGSGRPVDPARLADPAVPLAALA